MAEKSKDKAKSSSEKKTKQTKAKASSGKTVDKKKAATKKSGSKSQSDHAQYVPAMKSFYQEKIIPSLTKRFEYHSVMEVPRLDKITLNIGIGDAKDNPKAMESAEAELTMISGQKPLITKAKKDISNFKIRRGYPVGCTVTLRANRMYEFLHRLITVALPRTRDFNGLSFKSFDGRGNYSFGIKEQIIFTEIDYDKIDAIRGMDVAITTTAKSDDEAYWLLREFGFPLRDKPIKKQQPAAEAA